VVNYNEVRAALGEAIAVYSPALALNTYSYVPRSITPPAVILQPVPRRTIDYLEANRSRSAKWRFNVIIVVGQVDEEAAQQQAGDMISPGSSLLNALNTRMGTGYAQVTDGGISQMQFDQGLYTYAELSVVVLA
jgi:hypothetical protein